MDFWEESGSGSDSEEDQPSASSASAAASSASAARTADDRQDTKPKKRSRPRKPKAKPKPAAAGLQVTEESLQDVVNKLQDLGYSVKKDDDERSTSSQGSRGGRGNYRGRGGYRGKAPFRGGGRGESHGGGRGGMGGGGEESHLGGARGREGGGGANRGRGGPYQGRGGVNQGILGDYPGRGGANTPRGGATRGRGGVDQPRGAASRGRGEGHPGRAEGVGDPMEWHVFKEILHRFGGRLPIAKVHEVFSPTWGVDGIVEWCRTHRQKFVVFDSETSGVTYIGIRHFRCRLCFHYNVNGCQKPSCTYLHICRSLVCGYCALGSGCTSDHHFESQHNQDLIRKMGLHTFDAEDLKKIIRCSNLQACGMYNSSKGCPYGERCYRLHICENFVEDRCQKGDECEHDHDFESMASRRLLKLFDFENLYDAGKTKIVKSNVLVNRQHYEKSAAGKGPSRGRGRGRGRGSRIGSRQQSRRNSDDEAEDDDPFSSPAKTHKTDSQPQIIPPLIPSITDFKKKRSSATPSSSTHPRPTPTFDPTPVDGFRNDDDDDDYDDGEPVYSYHLSRTSESDGAAPVVPRPAPAPRLPLKPTSHAAQPTRSSEHIHEDDAQRPICVDYVLSLSSASPVSRCAVSECPKHHVRHLYAWQVKVFNEGWDTLVLENEEIEKAYCSPMKKDLAVKIFTRITGLENQFLLMKFSSEESMSCEVLAQGIMQMELPVRRLSTPSGDDPRLPQTRWQWYYEGTNTWHKYEYNAAMALEKAFTAKKLRVNVPISGVEYRVSFNRWYQLNRATETRRNICRRPKAFIAQDHVLTGQW